MQVRVDPARRRRQLLRKDYGMQPGELLHPLEAPTQPALQVQHRIGNGHLPIDAVHWQQDRRQLAVPPCDPTISAAVYGDINFDCQYTFVQVGFLAVHHSCCMPLCSVTVHIRCVTCQSRHSVLDVDASS